MKKFLSILTMMVLVFTLSTGTVFAANTEVYNGVSPIDPGTQISTRSTTKPTKVWNIAKDGEYSFGGTSNHMTLYTNYKFQGNQNYSVTVKNSSDKYSLTVKVVTWHTIKTVTVKASESKTFSVEGLEGSTKIYLSFSGSYQNFSGTISGFEW